MQMNGLAALVENGLKMNPLSGSLYAFTNKRRNALKLLAWDRTGFILWHKRLEREKFKWPLRAAESVISWNGEQLHWLLEGYDVARMEPHKTLEYSRIT
jgi:transposase